MNPQLVRDLVLQLAALPPAERSNALEAACDSDPDLQARVAAMLAEHLERGVAAPLDADGQPATATLDPAAGSVHPPVARSDLRGLVVAGRYTLERKIGEGGMGEVWIAQQSEPVRRRVALKLIKAGMDSRAVLQRFEQERQALALMEHPNISRVLDGGMTPDGQPFFAMELVDGKILTRYCDDEKLRLEDRLRLFVTICKAVQHAHQKGVVHRDLKPANILVTDVDGRPVPKVIDFGVAKATAGKLTLETMATGFGALVGTLEYMSPEQADSSHLDVDTRSDIYSLGVILYELLTGLRPIDGNQLRQVALTEMIRIIQEEEPSRPSTRLSTALSCEPTAAMRQIDPRRLMATLRGELDWIVMKCLEKDRNRRYETANALARDIERFLAGEEVEARPPSTGYRLSKFLRRNRVAVIAASLVFAALLLGMTGTTLALKKAQRLEVNARREAGEKELARAAAAERAEGERQAKESAEAISSFVIDDFLALTSVEGQAGEALTRDATLRDLLDRAAAKLVERHDLDPLTEAALCWIVGVSYRRSGDTTPGIPFLERAVELRRHALGPDAPLTLDAENSLAVALLSAGQLDRAKSVLEGLLPRMRETMGPDDESTISTMGSLAAAHQATGEFELALALAEEAVRLSSGRVDAVSVRALNRLARIEAEVGRTGVAGARLEETLELARSRLGPDHEITHEIINNLAILVQNLGDPERSVALLEQVYQSCQATLEPDHPLTLATMNNLAVAYEAAGRVDDCVALLERVMELTRKKFGERHPDTFIAMSNMGKVYADEAMRPDLGVPLLEAAFEGARSVLGLHTGVSLACLASLGNGYLNAGRNAEAVEALQQALEVCRTTFGQDHHQEIPVLITLAEACERLGESDRAWSLLEDALELSTATLGSEHIQTLTILNNRACHYLKLDSTAMAIELLTDVSERLDRAVGPDHPQALLTKQNLCDAFIKVGEPQRAIPILQDVVERTRKTRGADFPMTLVRQYMLAVAHSRMGRPDLAIPILRATLERQEAVLGVDDPRTMRTALDLGTQLYQADQTEAALPQLEKIREQTTRVLPPGDECRMDATSGLATAYWRVKRYDEAIELFEELLAQQAELFGRRDPRTLHTIGNLGVNCSDAGRLKDAIPLLEESHRGYLELGQQREVVWTGQQLMKAYTRSGDLLGIAMLVLEQLPSARRALPPDSPRLAGMLAQIGQGLLQGKRWSEAEPYLQECVDISARTSPGTWQEFTARSMLGAALMGQGKHEEAEPLLQAGYHGLVEHADEIPEQARGCLQDALDRLIRLYEATGRDEEAARLEAGRK